jgi:hypothetical protein
MYPLKPNQGYINLPFNPPRPSLIFVRKARAYPSETCNGLNYKFIYSPWANPKKLFTAAVYGFS